MFRRLFRESGQNQGQGQIVLLNKSIEALNRHADALAAWDEVLRQPDSRTINLHTRKVRIITDDVRQVKARVSRADALARLGRRGVSRGDR